MYITSCWEALVVEQDIRLPQTLQIKAIGGTIREINKAIDSIQSGWLFRMLTSASLKKSKCLYQIESFLEDLRIRQSREVCNAC